MQNTNFPNLFSPIQIGSLTIKNRLFSAPMASHAISNEGYMTKAGADFYEILAKGGVGMVCIGETLVHSETGNDHGWVLRLDDPGVLPSLLKLTDTIHRYGACVSIELLHPGRRADPRYNKDHTTYGPTGGLAHYGEGQHEVTELTEEMIDVIVNAYGDAAEIAKIGGCDMVTVHGGHGWLLNQFLSPANNQRTDRFGGSIENRARIYIMVADNIRAKCGKDFPIEFRISGDDFMEDGATLADTVELAKLLAPHIDSLHVSAVSFHNRRASIRMFPSTYLDAGCNAFLAEEIKKHVSIPVTTVGAFNDPAHMEKLISEKRVDAINMGRALLADPMLPEKARTGRESDILPCIRCNNCMSANFVPYVKYPLGVSHCSVNPWHGLISEHMYSPKPYGHQKVVVVGGGPAGMEAALGAAEMGHEVTLYEKTGVLGGMLNHACLPPFKKSIRDFIDVLTRRIENAENIDLKLNTEATPEMVKSLKPDALIVAVGGEPIMLKLPGSERENVIGALEIHKPGTKIGERVVIIGGGLIGCEEGIALAKYEKKQVTILEMTDKFAADCTYIHHLATQDQIEHLDNLELCLNHMCTAITAEGVEAKNAEGKTEFFPADTVIIAAGMKPRKVEAQAFANAAPTVINVGDCTHTAQMADAVLKGYFAGYNLQRL